MLYSYFFNMLKVGVPGATQVPQLLVYNQKSQTSTRMSEIFYAIGIRSGAVVNDVPAARQSRGLACRARQVESLL